MLKILSSWDLLLRRCRSLTVTETSIALRPFILRVHPDLFSKYGEDKVKKNEDSLKKLNEYMHKLHNNEHAVPISLLFHLRQISTDPSSQSLPLQPVNIDLVSRDVAEAVRSILKSCSLSLDYLTSLGASHSSSSSSTHPTKPAPYEMRAVEARMKAQHWHCRPKDWFEPRRSGRRWEHVDPTSHKNYHQSLQAWLVKNSKSARQKQAQMHKKVQDVEASRQRLLHSTGLRDVLWRDGWSIATHGRALRTLHNLCLDLPDPQVLKGRTVVFSNVLGISVEGFIVLRQDTVATSWRRVLLEMTDSDRTLGLIPRHEQHLSDLMGLMPILPPRNSVCIAENYLQHIMILIKGVKEHKFKTKATLEGYNDIRISVECTTGPITMTEQGDIMLPSSCPVFLIFDYIRKHAAKARNLQTNFKRTQLSDEALISLCQSMLRVKSLTRDASITRQQMVMCCKRLIQLIEARDMVADVSGLDVRVGQLYCVNMEGEVTIPWNF